MTGSKDDLISYRLSRSKDTFDDATILADKERWNSAINRLYYSAYYAVIAILLKYDLKPTTHNGAKSAFSEHFIKIACIRLNAKYSQEIEPKGEYKNIDKVNTEKAGK